MSKNKLTTNRVGTATVLLLSFLLFYFPSVITILLRQNTPLEMQRISFVMSTTYAAIFCLNYFVLIPKALFEHRARIFFYTINAALICMAVCLIPIWFEAHGGIPGPDHEGMSSAPPPVPHEDPTSRYVRFAIRDSVMMIFSIVLAYALQFSRYRERLHHRELQLNAEKRQLELRGLKMQLNPHFLFNSLNNIYALISISPDRAQGALHDLSGMLRYMIYDASASGVPLIKEMDFIDDFVRLSSLRMNGSARIDCRIDRTATDGLSVAPLLYLTIVENAFKHYSAPTGSGSGFISIDIEAGQEWVTCRVENTCGGVENNDRTGVGLSNISRQLGLLYPGDYILDRSCESGRYLAILSIRRDALKIGNPT